MIAQPSTAEMLAVLMNLRDQSREEIEGCMSLQDFWTFLFQVGGYHWMGAAGGEPAALIGTYRIEGDNWGMYGVGTDRWPEIMRDVTRTARRELISTAEAVGARRAECFSMTSHTKTHGWLRLVGLQREAEFPGYGRNGQSYTMFAWNKEVPDVPVPKTHG